MLNASFSPDTVYFVFDGEFVEACEGKGQEQADSAIKRQESVSKSALDLFRRACGCCGIWNAPVSRHRLAGPYGAHFARGIVTNSEHEIHFRRAGPCEFLPIFAAQTARRESRDFKLSQRFGADNPRRADTRTIASECGPASVVENCLGHDGARGIAGAEKQHVVAALQEFYPFAGSAGAQQDDALQDFSAGPLCTPGFLARMKALANLPSTWGAIASTSTPFALRKCRASSIV
jgi:hypothetical protein